MSEFEDKGAKECAADGSSYAERQGVAVAQRQACTAMTWEMSFPATLESVALAIEFAKNALKEAGYPLGAQAKLIVVVDEIVSNVARYAYGSSTGDLAMLLTVDQESGIVEVAFVDEGAAFNPLNVPLPDVTTDVGRRGGRGLLIVRRFADDITYERKNGKNILCVRICMGQPVRKG